MSLRRLLAATLRHEWRSLLAVVAGTAVATGIVVGALGVGDSLRASLAAVVEQRLGHAELAVTRTGGSLRASLAARLSGELGTPVVPILLLEGVAVGVESGARVQRVQVVGVDGRFWSLAGVPDPLPDPTAPLAVANRVLARRLAVAPGGELVLRMQRANLLPAELSFSSTAASSSSRRFRLASVVEDHQLGRFSLRAQQDSPATLFVDLRELGRWLEMDGFANQLLLSEEMPETEVLAALRAVWQLQDLGLTLTEIGDGATVQLSSERVFLQPELVRAVRVVAPAVRELSTYLVNRIGHGRHSVPYSFISAPGAPLVGDALAADEVILNRWLADELQAAAGDEIVLEYFDPDSGAQLSERRASLRVREVVEIAGAAADPQLTPVIPGLAGAEDCRDWDPGIPIELERIRDVDEDYWDSHRGTPKAFVSAAAARRLWGNRYGELTGMRLATRERSRDELGVALLGELDPVAMGFAVTRVGAEGRAAAAAGVDFAQLFLGLSFFIVVAALLLTALLFRLNLDRRSPQLGLLRAAGWPESLIWRWLLAESAVLAALGAVAGMVIGVLFVHGVLWALANVWRGAVGQTTLVAELTLRSLAVGVLGGFLAAMAVMARVLWAGRSRPLTQQLAGVGIGQVRHPGGGRWSLVAAPLLVATALILAVASVAADARQLSAAFWAAGALLLLGSLAAVHVLMVRLATATRHARPTVAAAGLAAAAVTPRRSLLRVALLAVAVFLVVAVAANRRNPDLAAAARSSGSGGFAFYGELTAPLVGGLSELTAAVDPADEMAVVGLRRNPGDDASCRNINRVRRPPILGVPAAELSARSAFSFAAWAEGADPGAGWLVLDEPLADGAIPAVADLTVITWGLGKAVGDELEITDAAGQVQRLRLVAGLRSSIFQGQVLIAEERFLRLFPDGGGYAVLLVDAPAVGREAVAAELTARLQDRGLDLESTAERLARFLEVENTYLDIFLALGGLGLLLGTAGTGLLTLRQVLDRRAELATMVAMGFAPRHLIFMLTAEHGLLVALGLGSGALSAVLAVLPAASAPGAPIPWPFICGLLAAMAAVGLGSSLIAAGWALRGNLIGALRDE